MKILIARRPGYEPLHRLATHESPRTTKLHDPLLAAIDWGNMLALSTIWNRFHEDPMKRVLIPIAPQMHKRLKLLAVERETTLEAMTRAALEAYLSQHGSN